MDSDNAILVRYSSPTKFDSAEYGQRWRHMLDNGYETFIQVSKNSERPDWVRMGSFLEKAFEDRFYEETFIEECLKRYAE